MNVSVSVVYAHDFRAGLELSSLLPGAQLTAAAQSNHMGNPSDSQVDALEPQSFVSLAQSCPPPGSSLPSQRLWKDRVSTCGSSLLQESFALLLVVWRGAVCFPLVFTTFWLGRREKGEG